MSSETREQIKTEAKEFCYLCQSPGKIIYSGLEDRLFNVPGKWNFRQCQNKNCGLFWLDPRPLKEDIGKLYLDYYTHSSDNISESFVRRLINFIKIGYLAKEYNYYLDSVKSWQRVLGLLLYLFPGLKSEIDFEVMYLKSKPGAKLLDVGCGSGKFILRMRDLGWQVEGTEIDPKAVETAKNNKLDVRLGELAEQKYPEKSFDAITLNSVIEHVLDPENLLKECRRILKDNGILMTITPNAKSWWHSRYKDKWFPLDPPRHLFIFSFQNLKGLVQKAGFKNTAVWTTARNLRSSLLGSWDIKNKGRHEMAGYQPWSRRLIAGLWQITNIGDEIVLKAKKL